MSMQSPLDLVLQAEALFARNEVDQACLLLSQVVEANPNHARALNDLGMICYSRGAMDYAARFFRRTLDLDPGDLACRTNLITLLLDQGHLSSARELLVLGAKMHPDAVVLGKCKQKLLMREKLARLPLAVLGASDLLEKNPERRLRWGDHWFSRELCAALTAQGAKITTEKPKVLLHLYGVGFDRINTPTYNIVWLHSHPDTITAKCLALYDHVFCIAPAFLPRLKAMGVQAEPLVGATGKRPAKVAGSYAYDLVFVANGKAGQGRKIIRDLMSFGDKWTSRLKVWGEGWEQILPAECIGGLYYDNDKLSELYASARVCLNDHHEDMRREGFLNPRILDIMAAGGVVLSDDLAGASDLFGDALLTYRTPEELDRLLTRLFSDDDYRAKFIAAGQKVVQPYRFECVAEQILAHLVNVDEEALDARAKNRYMETIWAPVKGKLDTDRIRRIKEVTAEQCVGTVLDVGCANGDSTALMLRHNPALRPTGLELTDWGIREARANHPEIKFVQGSATRLPFPDRAFDTVVLDHIIEHFVDPTPLLYEARRVARSRVVVGIPIQHLNDPDHKISWSVDDFHRLLAGFFPRHEMRGMREPDSVEVKDELAFNFAVGTGYLEAKNRQELPGASPCQLHLGCGHNRLSGFVNVDIVASPAVDLLADSRRLPLLPGTVTRIETYHMIEHLPRHDFVEALFEWNRVLVEGGDLVIECPDFDATVREYVDGRRFRINNIFGLQRHVGDFHQFGYGYPELAGALATAGFGGIRQETPTDYHAADEPSLRVAAIKVRDAVRPPDLRRASILLAQQEYARALAEARIKV